MSTMIVTIQRPDYSGVVGYSVERDTIDVDITLTVAQENEGEDVFVAWASVRDPSQHELTAFEADELHMRLATSRERYDDAVQALRDNNEWRYDSYEPARVL